jgi:hypothetical protein
MKSSAPTRISDNTATRCDSFLAQRPTSIRYIIEAVFCGPSPERELFRPGLYATFNADGDLQLVPDPRLAWLFYDFGVAHERNGELRARGWPTRVFAVDIDKLTS